MSIQSKNDASRFSFYVSRYKFLAVTLAIAGVAAWPLLAEPGLLNTRGGGDSPFLLQRLQQMETAVLSGHFPVRWMPDANYGYGYPFFNYYAPLSIYITLFFRLLGFSYVPAIQLSQLAGFLAAAWGMFALARRWFKNEWAGLLAAAAYTIAPFHMVNVYVRGDSLAEFWAMAFYPLVILAADEAASSKVAKWQSGKVVLLALAYAGLILSHNISALIFSPFLLLYILLRGWQSKIHHSSFIIHHSLCALLLALALSAWFFVPALAEQSLAQLGPVTEGYFHFSNHFRGLDLVQGGFFFDYNPNGGLAFQMGLVQAVTAVLGLITLLFYKNRTSIAQINADSSPVHLFITISLLIATIMITPLSRPLWDNLPLLPFTQFPWRFLSVQAFAGALAAGGLALLPWRKMVVPVTAVLLLTAGLGHLKTDHLTLTDADISAAKLAQYEWFTGNIGTTISAEYLPHTMQPRPYTSPWLNNGQRDGVRALTGQLAAAQRMNESMTHQVWRVEVGTPTSLIFPTLHWPGWMGQIDGERVAIRPSPGSGLIMLDVPAGPHEIMLKLTRTPIRLAAELLSLTAFLLTIWLVKPTRISNSRRPIIIIIFVIVGLAIALRLWPEPVVSSDNLTWDLAQMGYLHHDEAIQFSSGAVLTGYTIDRDVANGGETVAITLNWQENAPAQATVALAAGAKPHHPIAALLTEQTQPVQAGSVTYRLAIPENAPSGLYVPRLLLDNGRALTPSGQRRGDLYLRPLRIKQAPITNLQPPTARLELRPLTVQPRGDVLDVQLAWWTAQPLSHNYNVSLRLLDAAGRLMSQFDSQPGYGFLPSSGWPAGEWINDWLTAPKPIPENAPYALVAILYDSSTGENVLIRRLGQLDKSLIFKMHEPVFVLPDDRMGETAVFSQNATPIIQLSGYQKKPNGLTLTWRSLAATPTNYTRFLHITDPLTGEILAQVDGYAMGDSYPTSQWQPGEVITDMIPVDWSALPGDAAVWVGWYENLANEWPRLTAAAPDKSPFPDNRVPLESSITFPQTAAPAPHYPWG